MRKENLKGEYIFRKQNEYFFTIPCPYSQPRENYPWEEKYSGGHPKITKEFFRCKGSALNPMVSQIREGKETLKYFDCSGRHGLPLQESKEFVYPCLVELLNYIQEKTMKRVVITSGHRCPTHNLYIDYSPSNWSSKHMLGAEVDFYVEGMENEPLEIIALIQRYYAESPKFGSQTSFTQFQRYEKKGLNVSTPPWFNKEIFIKQYLSSEGRNVDNPHPYPYIGIQVRFDCNANAPVAFDSKHAQNYLRY